MDLGLTDKVALVTGGSGGIGAAVVRCFASEGARVAIGYHDSEERAARLADELPRSITVSHDLDDPASGERIVERVLATWGRLDALVTCAWKSATWPSPDRDVVQLSRPGDWREQLGLNVEGTARVVQAVLSPMAEAGWGRIVMISSGAAEGGQPGLEAYAAAKSALHAFNRSLASGLGRRGILSNVVMPGFVAHERNRSFIPAAAFEQWASTTATGRLATAEDIAAVVTFLASAANGSTTGSVVRVTAGL
jgi:3-oxoacyl-[acyl-carrier protein] reductase